MPRKDLATIANGSWDEYKLAVLQALEDLRDEQKQSAEAIVSIRLELGAMKAERRVVIAVAGVVGSVLTVLGQWITSLGGKS
jgi:hypothetical protein